MTNERLDQLRDLQFHLVRLLMQGLINPADAIRIGDTINGLMISLSDGVPHEE